ncbi:CHAT domain-containing protein [Micromonospora chalcea]|uniref:CHAT domain-containing protein n=1 Tax=Micromonospora chalcea TaxID=1874 RepID=UPI003D75AD09
MSEDDGRPTDKVSELRDRLDRLSGGERAHTLVELGRALVERYWRSGPGSPASLPDLTAAIEAFESAHALLGETATIRPTVRFYLGWLLGVRHSAHGGATTDRERGITLLGAATQLPHLPPSLGEIARLTLGQLHLSRAVDHLRANSAAMLPSAVPGVRRSDLDAAIALFRKVLVESAPWVEIAAAAKTYLGIAEVVQTVYDSTSGDFDTGRTMSALTQLQHLLEGLASQGYRHAATAGRDLARWRREADYAAAADAVQELRHAFDGQTSLQGHVDPTTQLQLHLNRHPEDAAEALRLLAELRDRGSRDDRMRGVLAEFERKNVDFLGLPPIGSGPGTAQHPDRLLVARAPTQVPVGRDLSVDVRIISEGHPVPTDAVMSPMASLVAASEGTPVTVTIHVPAGLHPEGPLQQTVLLKPGEDPSPIRFGFGARTPGLHRIDVTAWAGGTFLAEVTVEVSADVGGAFRDGQPKAASLGAASARPGEVTMEVRFNGGQYTFQLRSDTALFAPVVESVANTPDAAVENAIKELQQLAGGSSRYNATMTREVIRAAGIQLWSEMVPADIRDQFWQVGADMSAFTIATDHDLVPWELLYPLNADNDAGFLVEQVPVVRRTYGQRRTPTVGLGNPRFVVPPKAPAGAHDEIAAVTAILGATHSDPITKAEELLALINSGHMGATHFACHNTFSADGSSIDMDGGRFKPALLAEAAIRRTLERTGPLVFINACRSAGTAPTYTRMLGWAQQFMSSGAGAFVGTLWAVRTESSARFATAFYRSLAEGATLGAAALVARTEQQEDPLDPTWLAYTVYGDPFAIAA